MPNLSLAALEKASSLLLFLPLLLLTSAYRRTLFPVSTHEYHLTTFNIHQKNKKWSWNELNFLPKRFLRVSEVLLQPSHSGPGHPFLSLLFLLLTFSSIMIVLFFFFFLSLSTSVNSWKKPRKGFSFLKWTPSNIFLFRFGFIVFFPRSKAIFCALSQTFQALSHLIANWKPINRWWAPHGALKLYCRVIQT